MLMLFISTTPFVYAEDIPAPDAENNDTQIELVEKEEIVETKSVEEEVKIEVEENNTEEIEPVKEEVSYPFVVTFHFFYRGPNGWKESNKFSYTIKDENTKSGTKAMSYYEKQILNNKLDKVTCGMTTYTYTGEWVGGGKTLTASDKVQIIGSEYSGNTDINFYAQYTEEKNVYLSMEYIDKIANGSGSWSNQDAFSGYTHTFKTPADIPEHYEFMYWENMESNDTYVEGDSLSINTSDLEEDTEIQIYAIYQPSVIVNYYNGEELVKTVESFDKIVLNDFVLEDETFDKWVVNSRSVNDAEEVYYAPDFGVEPEYLEINVMAKFKDPEIQPEDKPTPVKKPQKPSAPTEITKTTDTATATQSVEDPKIETTITEPKTPTAAPEKYWALLNLILSILTVIFGLIFVFYKKDDELEDEDKKKVNREKLVAALIAVCSVVAFILTEDMTATMTWMDKWTLSMLIILLGEFGVDYYIKKNSKYEEEEVEAYIIFTSNKL